VGDGKKNKGWWDEECWEKREVRRALREWRKGKENKQKYQEKRREYRELCEEKKRKKNERWEKEVEGVRTENQVWGIINKERNKWKGISEGIRIEKWKKYFKGLQGGVEGKERGRNRVRKGGNKREPEEG